MITSKNIHLLISSLIVIPTGILYGFKSDLQFELYPKTIDEFNFYKAIMGLYLGFSMLWIYGILKPQILKTAIITNIVFMLGLGLGRTISMFSDGIPTFGYKFGVLAELFLGFYGIWILSKIDNTKKQE
ncbi:DUF4345 domain-containing protein [Flavobacterium gelidilacus]|jgi:hypothetical protein|uniref:DUF4345 domain-containing protein n=1 Tax=Flavobacterium gelidilacus TaxID=206041 RepID=UPI00040F4845|nr:DUF4345 domain-containing protein [Flavobacterium gelidilacus]